MDLTRRGFLKLAGAVVGGIVAKKITGDEPKEDKYKEFGIAKTIVPVSSLSSDGITTSAGAIKLYVPYSVYAKVIRLRQDK